jgi:hypothetical protein
LKGEKEIVGYNTVDIGEGTKLLPKINAPSKNKGAPLRTMLREAIPKTAL